MYLSKSETATILGVSYRYVTDLIADGTLKVELNVLGKERILQKEVLKLKAALQFKKEARKVPADFDRTKYINSAELADRLGVSRASVTITYKQKIRHLIMGREVLFASSAVDQYVEENKIREEQIKGYLTIDEAAKIIGISMGTAHLWCAAGRLSCVKGTHGQKFISPEEAERARKQIVEEVELRGKQTEGYLSIEEAARIIGASRATLYNWCASGGLAYSLGERNKKMIHPDEVERARKEYAGVAANILRNKV